MVDRSEHILKKLERAEEHILEIELEVRRFLDDGPRRSFPNNDPKAAEAFESFTSNRVVPVRVSILTGEVIYQLRSSLDHLVCALVEREGGKISGGHQFPTVEKEPKTDKEVASYERQIQGIRRPEVLQIIEHYQPYSQEQPSGGYWLRVLKRLSNRDKHRALILHSSFPERRITLVTEMDGGIFLDMSRPEGSTEAPMDNTSDMADITREIVPFVTFAKWGDSNANVGVADGLRSHLYRGVRQVVRDLSPFAG